MVVIFKARLELMELKEYIVLIPKDFGSIENHLLHNTSR
jgi:hypothetical protein